jgi:hypothetical protein
MLFSVTTVSAATAVYAYFTQDLPDFAEIERLGEDVEVTFETTKIYAWGDDTSGDGQRDLVLIYEIIDPLGGDRQWLKLEDIPKRSLTPPSPWKIAPSGPIPALTPVALVAPSTNMCPGR